MKRSVTKYSDISKAWITGIWVGRLLYIRLKCDDIHTCLVYGRSCLEFEKLRKKIFAKDMEWKENGEHNFSRDSAGERLEQETPVYVSYRS